jgi:lipopolysaccharide export system protein LptA
MLILFVFCILAIKEIITESTYKSFLRKTHRTPAFILMFSSHCGHCRAIHPTWIDLMNRCQAVPDLIVGEIDCVAWREACRSLLSTTSWPTFGKFTRGRGTRILPVRTLAGFTSEAERIRQTANRSCLTFPSDFDDDFPVFVYQHTNASTADDACQFIAQLENTLPRAAGRIFIRAGDTPGFEVRLRRDRAIQHTGSLMNASLAPFVAEWGMESFGDWELEQAFTSRRRFLLFIPAGRGGVPAHVSSAMLALADKVVAGSMALRTLNERWRLPQTMQKPLIIAFHPNKRKFTVLDRLKWTDGLPQLLEQVVSGEFDDGMQFDTSLIFPSVEFDDPTLAPETAASPDPAVLPDAEKEGPIEEEDSVGQGPPAEKEDRVQEEVPVGEEVPVEGAEAGPSHELDRVEEGPVLLRDDADHGQGEVEDGDAGAAGGDHGVGTDDVAYGRDVIVHVEAGADFEETQAFAAPPAKPYAVPEQEKPVTHDGPLVSTNATVRSGDAKIPSSNTTVFTGNATITSGNTTVSSGNVTINSGNATVTSRDATILSTNATVHARSAAISSGNVTIISGNVTVVSGNITIISGGIVILSGNVTIVSDNVTIIAGNNTVPVGKGLDQLQKAEKAAPPPQLEPPQAPPQQAPRRPREVSPNAQSIDGEGRRDEYIILSPKSLATLIGIPAIGGIAIFAIILMLLKRRTIKIE